MTSLSITSLNRGPEFISKSLNSEPSIDPIPKPVGLTSPIPTTPEYGPAAIVAVSIYVVTPDGVTHRKIGESSYAPNIDLTNYNMPTSQSIKV